MRVTFTLSRATTVLSPPALSKPRTCIRLASSNIAAINVLRYRQIHESRPTRPASPTSVFHLPQTICRASATFPRRWLMTTSPSSAMTLKSYKDILKGKYPAKAHAKKVADYILARVPDSVKTGVIYLESRSTKLLEDNDEPEPFRQRRPFYYFTGSSLADAFVTYDIASEKLTLFIQPVDPDSVIWSGLPVSAEEALSKWEVDEVKYVADVNAHLASLSASKTVYAMGGQVSDHITFLEFEQTNFALLKEAIDEARVVKDEYELALMQQANDISSGGHHAVYVAAKTATNERELEATFLGYCVGRGAREQAYSTIAASGRAAATLHYIKNDQPLANKQLFLCDAGGEWNCYAADITRTFPLSGKFTKEARAIYDIVLRMQLECIALLKEGTVWDDVHLHAHKVAIEGLLALGILKGDAADILEARTSVAFFPHGLGHYLGMDTHDTGGHANYDDKDPLFRYLRVRGKLPAGSVITVEPGVYFCEFIIKPYLKDPAHSKYIDTVVLDKYWDVGGVRIEDNLVITKTGSWNLTTAAKDPDELETIFSSA